jgi:hypothetical protein
MLINQAPRFQAPRALPKTLPFPKDTKDSEQFTETYQGRAVVYGYDDQAS